MGVRLGFRIGPLWVSIPLRRGRRQVDSTAGAQPMPEPGRPGSLLTGPIRHEGASWHRWAALAGMVATVALCAFAFWGANH